jgi:AbiV family abortive infection protein
VVRNAKHLFRDAVLLNDKGRHASAFALAVLGLVEIGKAILRRWGLLDSDGRFHLRKQLPGGDD